MSLIKERQQFILEPHINVNKPTVRRHTKLSSHVPLLLLLIISLSFGVCFFSHVLRTDPPAINDDATSIHPLLPNSNQFSLMRIFASAYDNETL